MSDDEMVPEGEVLIPSETPLPEDTPKSICAFDKLKMSQLDRARVAKEDKSRKRKAEYLEGARGRGPAKKRPRTGATTITARMRMGQHPDECLEESELPEHVFCAACREPVSVNSHVLKTHIRSKKHATAKERRIRADIDVPRITSILCQTAKDSGKELSARALLVNAYRFRVVKVLLAAGIPLFKVAGEFRELLEDGKLSLTDSSHLRALVPDVRKDEFQRVLGDVRGVDFSIVFDGSTLTAECYVVVIRFVSANFAIQQRIAALEMLKSSPTADDLARVLNGVVIGDMHSSPDLVRAVMHDAAPVNDATYRMMRPFFRNVVNINCLSHAVDNVGKKAVVPHLDTFFSLFNKVLTKSTKARLLWRSMINATLITQVATRWWSKFEAIEQLFAHFHRLDEFLASPNISGVCPKSLDKMRAQLANTDTRNLIQMECAALVEGFPQFCATTYFLEGDGFLAPFASDRLTSLAAFSNQMGLARVHPIVTATATRIAAGPVESARYVDHAYHCYQPAFEYFYKEVYKGSRYAPAVSVFDALRVFHPARFLDMAGVGLVDGPKLVADLAVVPAFNSPAIAAALNSEIAAYATAAAAIPASADPDNVWAFWVRHRHDLPAWAAGARQAALIQPSSAAAERVFSMLRKTLTDSQESMLCDGIEAGIMLRYNTLWRSRDQ